MYNDLKSIIFFPKVMFIGIPILIFISLFFIPTNYIGLTKSSLTMNGSYKNKWLFDMIYCASLLAFINLHIAKFFKKNNFTSSERILEIFQFNGNPIYFKYVFYLIFFIYILSMNVESTNSTRFLMEYQRSVFINFFLYIFLFYYIFLVLGSIALPLKGDK